MGFHLVLAMFKVIFKRNSQTRSRSRFSKATHVCLNEPFEWSFVFLKMFFALCNTFLSQYLVLTYLDSNDYFSEAPLDKETKSELF